MRASSISTRRSQPAWPAIALHLRARRGGPLANSHVTPFAAGLRAGGRDRASAVEGDDGVGLTLGDHVVATGPAHGVAVAEVEDRVHRLAGDVVLAHARLAVRPAEA